MEFKIYESLRCLRDHVLVRRYIYRAFEKSLKSLYESHQSSFNLFTKFYIKSIIFSKILLRIESYWANYTILL